MTDATVNAEKTIEAEIAEAAASTKKPRKETVQVDNQTFQLFLFECRKQNMTQTKMKRAYAEKFGGAEGSALQKYTSTRNAYIENIKLLEDKAQSTELTDNEKNSLVRLKKVLGEITLRVAKGEGSRKKEDLTSDKSLDDLLALFGEKSGETPPEPKNEAPKAPEAPQTEPSQFVAPSMGQVPRKQLPVVKAEDGDIRITTEGLDISIHPKQIPSRELAAV